MVEPYFMSPSQMVEFRDGCKRKWGFRYILGYRETEGDSAKLGTEVHALLETYMNDKLAWDYTTRAGQVAALALPHLPTRGSISTESKFEMDSDTVGERPVIWRGSRDLVIRTERLKVVDYKTTGNFKWAKTEETLLTDPQAVVYSLATLREQTEHYHEVDLQWLYLSTKSRKTLPVSTTLDRPHVETQFTILDGLAREAEVLQRTVTDPLTLEPNDRMCDAYGGCPHRSRCNFGPEERLKSTMGFLKDIGKKQTGLTPTPPATAVAYTTEAERENALRLNAAEAERRLISQWTNDPLPAEEERPGVILFAAYGPINPPEAPEVVSQLFAPEQAEDFCTVAADGKITFGVSKATAEKPKRKRRTNAQIAADNAKSMLSSDTLNGGASVDDGPVYEVGSDDPPWTEQAEEGYHKMFPPADAQTWSKREGWGTEVKKGLTLYINCSPQGRPVVTVDALAAQANVKVCQAYNLTNSTAIVDYRQVPYGQGTGMLSGTVAGMVKEMDLTEVKVSTDSPEGQACVSALSALATEVIR